jgi:4-hydroxy-3-polyprenylbenzoate decarboxylase
MRLIVGITGSTGVIYGIRMLEILKKLNVETHLIMSEWATKCIAMETDYQIDYVTSLATSTSDETLVARAAGVTIKESRKLILMVRETPLSAIHLENMLNLSRIGVVILPPVTEFYTKPKSIGDIVNHGIGKCLDQFDLEHDLYPRWGSF